MLDVGFSELLVFGIIALLVLGPEKLPEAARFAAKWYSKFKRAISSVQNDIDRELRLSEFREQMQQEMQRIQELEKKMEAQMQELQQQKLLTEQENQTALENKNNLSIHYHKLNTVAPCMYFAQIWEQKQSCIIQAIQSTETHAIEAQNIQIDTTNTLESQVIKTPELKVAV